MVTYTKDSFAYADLRHYRKKTQVALVFLQEPFCVETQEGIMEISPDTCVDWIDGYYLAIPGDGSKAYAIAPSFVYANYEPIEE